MCYAYSMTVCMMQGVWRQCRNFEQSFVKHSGDFFLCEEIHSLDILYFMVSLLNLVCGLFCLFCWWSSIISPVFSNCTLKSGCFCISPFGICHLQFLNLTISSEFVLCKKHWTFWSVGLIVFGLSRMLMDYVHGVGLLMHFLTL